MRLLQKQATPVFQLTYVNPQLEVIYLSPVVAVSIDERPLNKVAFDDVNQTDLMTIAIAKALASSVTQSDSQIFSFGKGLSENPVVLESLSAGVSKALDDLYSTSDASTLSVGKGLAESAPASDAIGGFDIGKANSDSATADAAADIEFGKALASFVDAPTDEVILAMGFNRSLDDSATGLDEANRDFGKALEDAAPALEAISSLSLEKALANEIAVATDSALLALAKALSSDAAPLDQVDVSMGYAQLPLDTATADDLFQKVFGKGLDDSVSFTDQITGFDISKALADTAQTIDQADVNNGDGLEWSLGTGINESTGGTSETLGIAFSKTLTNSVSVLDEVLVGSSAFENLSDNTSAGESLSVGFAKSLLDSAAVNDLLAVAFNRDGFTDTSSGADAITAVSVGKALTDAKSSSDAGSLYMTDYADITYFAEDYVGSSRTF